MEVPVHSARVVSICNGAPGIQTLTQRLDCNLAGELTIMKRSGTESFLRL